MSKTAGRIPQVDAYIAKAAPFAQPILCHLREVVHEGAPGVVEQMKWSRPFFVCAGANGLWGAEIAQRLRADGVASSEGMGTFGKITSLDDLPSRSKMVSYVKEAAKQIATGERTKAWTRPRVAKAEPEIPAELAEALSKNKAAAKLFAAKGPGCRREYCAWIAGAKREETRAKRVAQAVTWIAEGKLLNWKYEKAS